MRGVQRLRAALGSAALGPRLLRGAVIGAVGSSVVPMLLSPDLSMRLFVEDSIFGTLPGLAILAMPIGIIAAWATSGLAGVTGLWLGSIVSVLVRVWPLLSQDNALIGAAAVAGLVFIPILPLPGYFLGRGIARLLGTRRLIGALAPLSIWLLTVIGVSGLEQVGATTAAAPSCPASSATRLNGRIAFVGDRAICVADLSTGVSSVVYGSPVDSKEILESPDWSPDGTQIAFIRGHEADDRAPAPTRYEIVIADAASGELRVLPSPRDSVGFEDPAWSPDGRHLVVAVSHRGYGNHEIAMVGQTGRSWRTLVPRREVEDLGSADWSPDGKTIVFAGGDDFMHRAIYTLRAVGDRLERIVDDAAFFASPAWSPDGRSIAFSRRVTDMGRSDLFLRDMATGEERRLIDQPAVDLSSYHAAWSPDGQHIACDRIASNGVKASTWIVPATGGEPVLAIDGGSDPSWTGPAP